MAGRIAKIWCHGTASGRRGGQPREIAAGADAQALADAYAAEHLPVRVAASRGFIDESWPRARRASASPSLLEAAREPCGHRRPRGGPDAKRHGRSDSRGGARSARREGLRSPDHDAIARKAFVSRTAVYFYFPNKRAVVDRL